MKTEKQIRAEIKGQQRKLKRSEHHSWNAIHIPAIIEALEWVLE